MLVDDVGCQIGGVCIQVDFLVGELIDGDQGGVDVAVVDDVSLAIGLEDGMVGSLLVDLELSHDDLTAFGDAGDVKREELAVALAERHFSVNFCK